MERESNFGWEELDDDGITTAVVCKPSRRIGGPFLRE